MVKDGRDNASEEFESLIRIGGFVTPKALAKGKIGGGFWMGATAEELEEPGDLSVRESVGVSRFVGRRGSVESLGGGTSSSSVAFL